MATVPITEAIELVLDCADGHEARRISGYLLKRRLIASASILPMNQVARWSDRSVHSQPVTMLLVTRPENIDSITMRIRSLLKKKVVIKTIPVESPSSGTLEWVDTAEPAKGK